MELTPVKTEEEKAGGKPSRWVSYPLLIASVAAAVILLPPIAGIVAAAPILTGVAAIGAATAVTVNKPWREKAVGFFSKVGGMFKDAFVQLYDDYKSAKGWAKERAEEAKAALPAPANDDAAPSSGLGAKASAEPFNKAADAAAEVKAKKPAPAPTAIQKLGM